MDHHIRWRSLGYQATLLLIQSGRQLPCCARPAGSGSPDFRTPAGARSSSGIFRKADIGSDRYFLGARQAQENTVAPTISHFPSSFLAADFSKLQALQQAQRSFIPGIDIRLDERELAPGKSPLNDSRERFPRETPTPRIRMQDKSNHGKRMKARLSDDAPIMLDNEVFASLLRDLEHGGEPLL